MQNDGLKIQKKDNEDYIFDIIRKKYVRLTPEEWVRQHFIHFLLNKKKYPKGFIAIEKELQVNQLKKRTDITIHNKEGSPLILVECKAPQVKLSQKTFEQAAQYNLKLKVPYLVITNGQKTYIAYIDHNKGSFKIVDDLPEKI